MNRSLFIGLLLAVLVGCVLRFPQLDARPMHNDESVNAIKLRALWEKGEYRYDPLEYHGPTLEYFSYVWMKLIGPKQFVDFTEKELRALTGLFGLGLILLLPLIADGMGRWATIGAAMLTAISPAMVFYSRYYIHEMLLVFFTLLAISAGWRYSRSGKLGWALLCGAAIGLMQATKETFVLTLAAIAAAAIVERLWTYFFADPPMKLRQPNFKHLSAAVMVWIVVVVVFFSSFFTNVPGIADSVRTYLPWVKRAGGASPHINPWNFYLVRLAFFHSGKLIWSEGLILALALAGIIAAFKRSSFVEGCAGFIRFIAFYTLILTAIYCVIGYKTPWCLLTFWQGMILLAGVGTMVVLRWLPKRPLQISVAVLLGALAIQLACQARRENTEYAADPRNPYVYGQTSDDLLNLVERVNALENVSPKKYETVIKVMSPESDFWPLPWYLRRFDQVGYWPEITDRTNASILIVSPELHGNFDKDGSYVMAGMFGFRPRKFFELYVETNLWQASLKAPKSP